MIYYLPIDNCNDSQHFVPERREFSPWRRFATKWFTTICIL